MVDVEAMLAVIRDVAANGLIEQDRSYFNWDDSEYDETYYRPNDLTTDSTIAQTATPIKYDDDALVDLMRHDLVDMSMVIEYTVGSDTSITLWRWEVTEKGRKFMKDPYGMIPTEPQHYLDEKRVWDFAND